MREPGPRGSAAVRERRERLTVENVSGHAQRAPTLDVALSARSEPRPARLVRLILGDQLNHAHRWFASPNPDVLYVLMEVRQETDYAWHHIQKVLGFFGAMRAFAEHLRKAGHRILYLALDDPRNQQSIPENLAWILAGTKASVFAWQLPDEWRLDQQ